jgi:GNAT superfamily N-acetyltransferase
MLDVAELRAAYDAELRVEDETRLPAGVRVEHDGPLHRYIGFAYGNLVTYRDLAGTDGAALDALIARQVAVFATRRERFEWKHCAHDLPHELPARLLAAGFVAEAAETVLVAAVADLTGAPRLPAGVALRELRARADLDRIEAMETAVWDEGGWLADSLEVELAVDPDALRIFAAETDEGVVSAGWMRFVPGGRFATLWGGATLPAWRGRGIYRALVAHRANLAAERGVAYVQVDASDASRPILERLGFVAVTTTTPFIWTPAS